MALALILVTGCASNAGQEDDTTTTSTTSGDPPDPPDPEVEEEVEPEEASTTTSTGDDVGTRQNPIPVGEAAQVDDYMVTVLGYEGDGTQAVLDENEFNEPPPAGEVFSLIRLQFEYVGDESGDPWADLFWSGIGDSNVASDTGDCSTYPESAFDVGELFPGGVAESNICLTVPEDDVDSLVLILEGFLSGRVFFALP